MFVNILVLIPIHQVALDTRGISLMGIANSKIDIGYQKVRIHIAGVRASEVDLVTGRTHSANAQRQTHKSGARLEQIFVGGHGREMYRLRIAVFLCIKKISSWLYSTIALPLPDHATSNRPHQGTESCQRL